LETISGSVLKRRGGPSGQKHAARAQLPIVGLVIDPGLPLDDRLGPLVHSTEPSCCEASTRCYPTSCRRRPPGTCRSRCPHARTPSDSRSDPVAGFATRSSRLCPECCAHPYAPCPSSSGPL